MPNDLSFLFLFNLKSSSSIFLNIAFLTTIYFVCKTRENSNFLKKGKMVI